MAKRRRIVHCGEASMSEYDLDVRVAEKARILARIEEALAGTGDTPPGFARVLYAGVSAEDLGAYDSGALAGLAAQAYAHLREPRLPGQDLVRLTDTQAE